MMRETRWLSRSMAVLVVPLLGCEGGLDPSTVDGGFPDALVVVVPPTREVDESGDLGLILSVRFVPGERRGDLTLLSQVEFTAYDDETGDITFSQVEGSPDPRALTDGYVGLPDPQSGVLELWFYDPDHSFVRANFDAHVESWVEVEDPSTSTYSSSLDFGAFCVMPCDREDEPLGALETRIYGRTEVWRFCYQPGSTYPPIDPRTSVWGMWRGPRGTLALEASRYTPPELVQNDLGRWDPERGGWVSNYVLEFVEHRVEGVRDIFLVEPETGDVVGLGERRLPEAPILFVRDELDRIALSDRLGRVLFRDDAAVSREPIYRAGLDGTIDEVTLDWGDATECLLTSIVEIGPRGHLITQQRPRELRPTGVVCVFDPDGSLVLSLPPDPDRAWVGFSDPVQWY
jgi:hypothetical protein